MDQQYSQIPTYDGLVKRKDGKMGKDKKMRLRGKRGEM
jgi:hypothetical protein